jgi:signal transduction histidine kinase
VLVERILRNLIANALRYTRTGGVLVACRRRSQCLRIEVWDTGIGIPRDQQQRVFEEFVQIANPERDRRKGLGLGLSIVRRLSRLLQHPLELKSRPGLGSMFRIELPLGGKPAVAPPRAAEEFAKRRIQVADAEQPIFDGMHCSGAGTPR